MATSAVFAIIDALIAKATILAGEPDSPLADVIVLDGLGNTNDPGDFLMVGAEDPDDPESSGAGTAEQEWAHANHTTRDETGEVHLVCLSWNGDGDQALARHRVRDITAALEDAVRADYTLGLDDVLWTEFGGTAELQQAQGAEGAAAQLLFVIRFRARI